MERDELTTRLISERDVSGSRFYSQPGFAVLTVESKGLIPRDMTGTPGSAMARVRSAHGEEPLPDAELGQPRVGGETYGRGAAG